MIAFRPAILRNADGSEGRDLKFCVESWSDSYRTANTAGLVSMESWKTIMRPEIERMLLQAKVIVAHEDSDPDPIADLLGFIAFDREFTEPYVYYVYVKVNYRRAGYRNGTRIGDGLGRRLFQAAGIDPAHRFNYAASTRKVRELERKIPLARWMPLLARFPLDAARRHDVESQW